MIQVLKRLIKKIPIAFTQNQRYDRQTQQVIKCVCKENSNCIDVGCHKGEVMDIFVKYAPNGIHYGFEPIPGLFDFLLEKYEGSSVKVLDYALSNHSGTTSFNYVVSNPSYSGIKKRQYDKKNEEDQSIHVKVEKLDNILPENFPVHLIKIDVEGGELQVLEGAVFVLKKFHPVIIFEHGLGASDVYGATPKEVYSLLTECGYQISSMKRWFKKLPSYSLEEFEHQYYSKKNYYFIAYF